MGARRRLAGLVSQLWAEDHDPHPRITPALQDSNFRSGVVPTTCSVLSVGMGWVIVDFEMAIPKVFRRSE